MASATNRIISVVALLLLAGCASVFGISGFESSAVVAQRQAQSGRHVFSVDPFAHQELLVPVDPAKNSDFGRALASVDAGFFRNIHLLAAICTGDAGVPSRWASQIDHWRADEPAGGFLPPAADCIAIGQQGGSTHRYWANERDELLVTRTASMASSSLEFGWMSFYEVGRSTWASSNLPLPERIGKSAGVTLDVLLTNETVPVGGDVAGSDGERVRYFTTRRIPVEKAGVLVDRLRIIVEERQSNGSTATLQRRKLVVSEGTGAVIFVSDSYWSRPLPLSRSEMSARDMYPLSLIYVRGNAALILGEEELRAFNDYWQSTSIWDD